MSFREQEKYFFEGFKGSPLWTAENMRNEGVLFRVYQKWLNEQMHIEKMRPSHYSFTSLLNRSFALIKKEAGL